MSATHASPIIVLGAARSGTKLLRGMLAEAAGVAMVPYDVNYLWRAADPACQDDELCAQKLTSQVADRLRRSLNRAAGLSKNARGTFVEKSVSNVLRIPYVLRALPEARFVHLLRDGRDVTESAMRCWQSPPAAGYALRKAFSFPWAQCFSYGVRQAGRSLIRLVGRGPAPCWGPCYRGMQHDARNLPLAEVCAWQWRRCVEAYERDRQLLAPERRVEVRYEELVSQPTETLTRVLNELALPARSVSIDAAAHGVKPDLRGGHRRLAAAQRTAIDGVLGLALVRHGYLNSPTHRSAA
ncbi:hypothetical protein Pla175_07550 [Pirellulimonas nuda]|uniref:Sulfotransferase domain protein n=1 Tax=Pirellulimonas nuda TaxID=2528009 RepID=A0A518D7G9_9BACT|nr:sulfotransferase [Pirellulimonas nuda]QDU87395.1 hypothetical protein Pla175_07550 [Pirellulimonas nuda]